MNAGQLGLGSSRPESSRPESSRPGSTRPNNISAWSYLGPLGPRSYFAYFFIRDASMNCDLYIKCSAKVEGIMIGSIYIAGLSNLFQSTGPTSLRYERRTRNIFLSCLFLFSFKQEEKKISGTSL